MSWNPWRGLAGHSRGVWALFAAVLVVNAGTMAIPFLVLYLTSARGFSATTAASMFAFYGAAGLVAGPLAGRACDRLGALGALVGSMASLGITLLLFPFIETAWATTSMVVALGLLASPARPAVLILVRRWTTPEKRTTAFSLLRLGSNLGLSVGPAIGGFLMRVSYSALFWVDGLANLAAAGTLLLLASRRAGSRGDRDELTSPLETAGLSTGAAGPASRRPPPLAAFPLFLVVSFLIGSIFSQFDSAMPLFLVRNLGLPATTFGFSLTLNTVLIILFEIPLMSATARRSPRSMIAVGAVLLGAGFGGLALARGSASVFATVVVWTAGEMLAVPTMSALLADMLPAERLGLFGGIHGSVYGLTAVVGPIAGVAVLERFGAHTLWGGVFACGLLAALLCVRLRPARDS